MLAKSKFYKNCPNKEMWMSLIWHNECDSRTEDYIVVGMLVFINKFPWDFHG